VLKIANGYLTLAIWRGHLVLALYFQNSLLLFYIIAAEWSSGITKCNN